jgi:hypothetical protein
MSETGGPRRFYGKYRATVVQNVDPELRGRIMCIVPDVLGLVPSGWCEACAPLSGPPGPPMGVYIVPPIGAGVWVEFEQGDPGKPIWSGCRLAIGEVPPAALVGIPLSPNIVMQTLGQNMIMISDAPPIPMQVPVPAPAPPATGGIVLRSLTGAMIVVNDTGIYINNGKGASIDMMGPSVMINKVALVVI